jgi:hypothetical protein
LATARDSVGATLYVEHMTTSTTRSTDIEGNDPRDVFDDPVPYLARYGITAEVVSDTSLPAAA